MGGGRCLTSSKPSCPSYSLASIKPPAARPCLPLYAVSPNSPAFPCPPPPSSSPYRPRRFAPLCGCPRRWRGSGDGRPRFGHCPPLLAAGAACAGGWPFLAQPSRLRRPRLGSGWTRSLALARFRLGRCPRRPRGPVPACGRQSGPRGERRRTVRLPAAPENLPRGSAPRNGAASARAHCGSGRFSAASVGGLHLMPPLHSARAMPSLTRVVQIRLTADFQRRLSVRAFPGRFLGSFRRFGGYGCPARLHFTQKSAPEDAARPPATRPEPFRCAKISGPLAFRRPPCLARTHDRARHRPERADAFGTGGGSCGPPRYGLPILGHFYNLDLRPSLARNAPAHLRAREIPALAARKTAVPYASPGAGAAEGTARLRRAPFFRPLGRSRIYDAQGRCGLRSTAPDEQPKTS